MNGSDGPLTVVALLAPATGRLEVDPLTGAVDEDPRGATMSAPDGAALEIALRLADAWEVEAVAVSVGGPAAGSVLADAVAHGVDRAIHVVDAHGAAPASVGTAVADELASLGPVLVVAGVHGSDVASAAVPAYVAHHLRAAQALGSISVSAGGRGEVEVVRRLDRGARERLRVVAPAVLSVEGSVATLRRAPLAAALADESSRISQHRSTTARKGDVPDLSPRPYRPRPHVVPAPTSGPALDRIRHLTGADVTRSPARSIEADPVEAAEMILDQLGEWGLGPRAEPEQ